MLVSQIEGEGDPEPDWIFLRVTAKHVIEVELKAARVLHKLELKCLQKVETSEINWKRMVSYASVRAFGILLPVWASILDLGFCQSTLQVFS